MTRTFPKLYFPGRYLTEVKRPSKRYIVRGILMEDFALWVISTIFLSNYPLAHFAGITALLISFWAVYERGYMDNDFVAATYEQRPTLSPNFQLAEVSGWVWQPWLWAITFGAAGTYLVRWPNPFYVYFAIWMLSLTATHIFFWVFNRLDKGTRVWMFAVLQLLRSCAFALVVPVHPTAATAIGAHVISKWIPYFLYRERPGDKWPEMPVYLMRLVFFVLLTAIVAVVDKGTAVVSVTTAVLAAWFLVRARRELIKLFRGARGIYQHGRDEGPPHNS